MAVKFLDNTGLAYFWSKIKSYVASLLSSKADDSAVVHIAGTETITGAKTFTSNVVLKKSSPQFLCQDTRGVKGTAPSDNLWNQFFYVRDNNNVSYGGIEHGYKTTRENRINLIVYPGTTNTTSSNARISVGYDTNGNWFTYSPTPAVADNSTKIATTAWVRTATGNTALNAATASAVAWSGVTNTPTTLADYGITDAKIANGTITLGSNSITPLTSVPSHNQASDTINAMTGYSKPSSGSAIATSDSLNSAIGKLEAKVDSVDDSNYVHLTGTEEINGYKVYAPTQSIEVDDDRQLLKVTELNISNPNITLGTDSSDFTSYSQILFTGSTQHPDNDRLGYWFYHHPSNSDSTPYMRMGLRYQFPNSDEVDYSEITVGYDEINNVRFALAPATSSLRTVATDIVTRGWIPQDTRIVHTTGNETIAGRKYFTSALYPNEVDGNWIHVTHPGISKGTLPSSQMGFWATFNDKDGITANHSFVTNWVGLRTDGETVYRISVARNDLNSDWFEWNLIHSLNGTKLATLNGEMVLTPSSTTSARLHLQMNDVDTTVTCNSDKIRGAIAFTDKNGTANKYRTAVIQSGMNSADSNFLWLRVYDPTVNSEKYDGICIRYPRGDSNTSITMPQWVTLRSPILVKGTNPSSTQYMHLVFSEKNVLDSHTSGRFGGIETAVNSSGQVSSFLIAYKNTANATTNAQLSIIYPASGDPYGEAPTYTNYSDNSNKIATTKWVQTFCETTKGYVHKSVEENITGTKWFKNSGCFIYNTGITKGTASSGNIFESFGFYDKNKARLGGLEYCARSTGHCDTKMFVYAKDTDKWCTVSCQAMSGTTDVRNFFPDGNGAISLGTSGNRWKQLFAATTTISTSDERLKSNIENVSDNLLDAWEELEFVTFKFKDAIESKGVDKARTHSGLIAQRIKSILEKYDIDGNQYGFLCWDHWEDSEVDYDQETGRQISTFIPAGDAYSLRYEEVLCIEAAYQRRKNKILENRISELEKQVSDMLQILQNLTSSNG